MKNLISLVAFILIMVNVAYSGHDSYVSFTDLNTNINKYSLTAKDLIQQQELHNSFVKSSISNHQKNTISSINCPVTINPTSMSFSSNAVLNNTINVMPNLPGCSDWNAAANVPWITITEPATGYSSGNNQVIYSISQNTSSNTRTGQIKINDAIFTVTQSGVVSCNITATMTSSSVYQASGGAGQINISASPNTCTWTATVSANTTWITILSGSSGTGNGQVVFTVAPNTGLSRRVGTITVANSVFTITQEGTTPTTCSYNINSQSTNLPYQASSNNTFVVTTSDSSCAWRVISMANWLTITSGASGTGSGAGNFSVTLNNGTTARSTTLSILGTSSAITITQQPKPAEPTCEVTLDPSSYSVDYKGGTSAFNVASNLTTCHWVVSTDDDWITISPTNMSGTGNGRVSFTVSQNHSTTSRTGKIFVNSKEFTITQQGFSGDSTNLGKAVDNTNLSWQSGGYLPFFVDRQEFYYGDSSAKSGPIPDSQSSWIQTSIKGPGSLSFYWKVSSETGFDTFKFTINGIRNAEISGNVDWRNYSIQIPEGNHTLRWTYAKDSAGSSGSDAGWLDKVEYVQSGMPSPKIVPLYRFYNSTTGAHFYTIDEREKEEIIQKFPQFAYEGIAYYVYSYQERETLPVYRFYNTRTKVHFYTIDESEKNTVIRMFPQFNYENIAFYAFPLKVDYSKPVYRLFNTKTGTHFYTIYESERDFVIKNYPDWNYEFISYFAIN